MSCRSAAASSLTPLVDALQQAVVPKDMNVPGFDFHALRGKPKRYSVHVNGPWCITFEF